MPTDKVPCIVCENPAASRNVGSGDVAWYECPRCGAFVLSGTAEAALPSMLAEVPLRRSLMSHRLRCTQRPGSTRLPTITTDDLPSFWAQGRLPTPGQQADALILWIGDHQPRPSHSIEIHRPALAALIGLHISRHDDADEFAWLNSQLEPKKLYELVPRGNNVLALIVSMEGWQRHEQLKKMTKPSDVMANSQNDSFADHRGRVAHTSEGELVADQKQWDVFISHAGEDKDDFVRPLAERLRVRGLRVWFAEHTLTIGDSLRRSIDRGLAGSRFGIVVISPSFLRKEWPQRELDGLVAREIGGQKVILPIWHQVTEEIVRRYSPPLADRFAARSADDLDQIVDQIMQAMDQANRVRTAPLNSSE